PPLPSPQLHQQPPPPRPSSCGAAQLQQPRRPRLARLPALDLLCRSFINNITRYCYDLPASTFDSSCN
ncbi:hypothetical protein BOX15_Mlig017552g1, partial [Macrostomum lignano]